LLVELSDGGSGGFVDTGIADLSGVRVGALPQVRERMTYVGSVLEEFVELDEQVVSIK
jgi:hypothetical protein